MAGSAPVASAGVLQFDAASYVVGEGAGALATVSISRTGGSSGAVSATFSTSDGSATAGVDYTPLNATVFFGDGDVGPKLVTVPIVPDTLDEIDKTVNLALSQPGGCAALGAQTTAVLTIRDDDAPAAAPSGLDPTFGNASKAAMPETGTPPRGFGGDRTAMALQADGKIVVVGTRAFSSNANFIVARYAADGSVDRAFGSDGNLSIDFFGFSDVGENVLVQPDGRILVSGQAQKNFDAYGLARINP